MVSVNSTQKSQSTITCTLTHAYNDLHSSIQRNNTIEEEMRMATRCCCCCCCCCCCFVSPCEGLRSQVMLVASAIYFQYHCTIQSNSNFCFWLTVSSVWANLPSQIRRFIISRGISFPTLPLFIRHYNWSQSHSPAIHHQPHTPRTSTHLRTNIMHSTTLFC